MPPPVPPFSALSARQEAFAGSYIRAVISLAGCTTAIPETDNDKVDIVAMSRMKGTKFTKPKIDIQSKCKIGPAPTSDPMSYKLDIETYDNLRDPFVTNPRILVVVFVPQLHNDWVMQDHAQLALKHCGYWTCLQDEPEVTGQDSKTVHLPKANLFSAAALQAMMVSASNGVSLKSALTLGALQ